LEPGTSIVTTISPVYAIIIKKKEGILFTWRKKVSLMRGRKEILGSMNGVAKSRGRTVETSTVISSIKGLGRTGGGLETGNVGLSHGSRKLTAGKGGTHK
jgi:hypothetical protein